MSLFMHVLIATLLTVSLETLASTNTNALLCARYYQNGNLETRWLPRLNEQSHLQGTPISLVKVDDFITAELQPLSNLYKEVIDVMGRQGVDSKLTLQLKLYDGHFESVQKNLSTLKTSIEAPPPPEKQRFWKRTKTSGEKMSISETIESFKTCRLSFMSCQSDLKTAINEAEQFILLAETIIIDYKNALNRLDELSQDLRSQSNNPHFSTLIDQQKQSIESRIHYLLQAIEMENQKTIIALHNLRQIYPLLEEEFQIFLARNSGHQKLSGVDWNRSAKNAAQDQDHQSHLTSFLRLDSSVAKLNYIKTLADLSKSRRVRQLTINESLDIIDNIKSSGADVSAIDDTYYSDYDAGLTIIRGRQFSGPLFILYLARATERSNDSKQISLFLGQLSSIRRMYNELRVKNTGLFSLHATRNLKIDKAVDIDIEKAIKYFTN